MDYQNTSSLLFSKFMWSQLIYKPDTAGIPMIIGEKQKKVGLDIQGTTV